MRPHRIHLKGPWQYQWLSAPPEQAEATSGRSAPVHGRIQMPADWRSVVGEVPGVCRFRRRFQRPTNLEPHERVFLVFDGIGGTAEISLNGRPLGTADVAADPPAFDITELLKPSNELLVELEFDPHRAAGQPGGLWAPVAIEIRIDDTSGPQ